MNKTIIIRVENQNQRNRILLTLMERGAVWHKASYPCTDVKTINLEYPHIRWPFIVVDPRGNMGGASADYSGRDVAISFDEYERKFKEMAWEKQSTRRTR